MIWLLIVDVAVVASNKFFHIGIIMIVCVVIRHFTAFFPPTPPILRLESKYFVLHLHTLHVHPSNNDNNDMDILMGFYKSII